VDALPRPVAEGARRSPAGAREGSNWKTLITFDSEGEPYHNQAGERSALTLEFSYVDYIRKNKAGRSKERVWQNVPIPDSLPGQGFCFLFIMRWLLELPEKGLEWCHKHGTLEYLKGFVQLKS
jgi:hypothetical protein